MPDGSKETRLVTITGERDEQYRKVIKKVEEDDGILPDDLPMGHQELQYPEISEVALYLVSLFHSAGMATATGMGLVGLSYQEIKAWMTVAGLDGILEPWQCTAIYTISRAYANECSAASKKDAWPPYTAEKEIYVDNEAIAKHVDDVFAGLIAAQKNK